jgi:multiple sugar transport system permease protein
MTLAAPAAAPAVRSRPAPRRAGALEAYLFLAPFLAVYAVFLVYPLAKGLWISLHDWELVGGFRTYIGILNYIDLWDDPMFWRTVRNTVAFVALTVPAMTVLALALALAVSGGTRLHGFFRGVFFASSVFSVSVVTLIWQMVLNGENGLLAHGFRAIGLDPVNVLGDRTWALPGLVVTTLWWGVGLPMALFIAALQQIPRDLYEAAELDHASRWAVLTRITLPAIRRTVLLVVVLEIVRQFQVFGQALLMTQGGPADSTRTMVQYVYETGFRDWQIGYASAMAMVLFVIMAGTSLVQFAIAGRED